jgi:hypothetical protein
MNSYAQVAWTRYLAREIDREFERVRAALCETHHRALNAGTLLLEAMAQVPPLTGPEWITEHTRLSLAEACGLMCLANAIPLLAEVEKRVEGLATDRHVEFRQAPKADGADPERTLDTRAHPDDAVLEAQIELCRAVLDRLVATPSELVAVERVLNSIQNKVAALLAEGVIDDANVGGSADSDVPF